MPPAADVLAPAVAEGPRHARQALPILLFVVFINLVGFGLVIPLLPFFAQSLEAQAWQITLLFSAYSVGQFFAEPFWGRLSDRIGRKPVLAMTLAANALSYLALAFAPTLAAALVLRLVGGLASGNISTIQGYIADITPPEKRAGRMGVLGAAFSLGFIVGPGLGGLLAQPGLGPLGFRIPLFVAAGLAAAACLGVLLFVRESLTAPDPHARRPGRFEALGEAWRHPVIRRVLLVSLVYMAAFACMESVFALWAERRFDWTPREVGLNFMVIGAVAFVGQGLLSGMAARRFGEAKVLTFGMTVFGGALLLQPFSPAWWAVPLISAVAAFGQSLALPNSSALISRSTDPGRQGAMLGLNMAAGSAGRMLGPILGGVLFSAVRPGAPFIAGAALAFLAAYLAVEAGRQFKRIGATS
jgi:predicted MFS family arabinose efflux permease